jgi:hypothetical protein
MNQLLEFTNWNLEKFWGGVLLQACFLSMLGPLEFIAVDGLLAVPAQQ